MKHPSKLLFGLATTTALIAIIITSIVILSPITSTDAEEQSEKTPAKQKPQGFPVKAISVEPMVMQLWKQYSGTIVAVDRAEIRPQVSGRITEIRFKDGQQIKKGEILIVIDPRPYKAAVKQAKAALETAKSQALLAAKQLKRAKELVKKQAVATRLLDQRQTDYHIAKAAVLNAEALVETAEINEDYAYIKAPISGKVSRAEITEGNLVQSGANAPILTSITSNDQIYVDFEIDEQTYITSIHSATTTGLSKIPVKVTLNNTAKSIAGFMHSFDNRIDPATGTIRARALFDNTTNLLLPGMSVSVEMGLADSLNHKQILISERAIGTDQDRKFVFIINKENKATYQEISIGQSINGQRIVHNGLKKGDIVITEGLMRIRPNTLVSPIFAAKKQTPESLKNQTQ